MRVEHSLRVVLAVAVVIVAAPMARADYYSNPEFKPSYRCNGIPSGIGDPNDPGGPASLHCQRLFWDLPVSTVLHMTAVSAPYAEDPVPRFPRGITDRPPPIWVGTVNNKDEGFEYKANCDANAPDCHRLCDDPLDVPYWQEQLNADGSPVIGTDTSGVRTGVGEDGKSTNQALTGPLFTLECQRGSRSYYGPWQTGGTVNIADCLAEPDHGTNAVAGKCQGPVFDRLASTQPIRFDNTDRLDDDAANGRLIDGQRLEWNTGTEYYNHFASHHGTCSAPQDPCADAKNPLPKDAYDFSNPSAQCYAYEKASHEGGSCYSGDSDPRCNPPDKISMGGFRNATQLPGRLSVPIPTGRGYIGTEDVTWGCNHHVVTQLPPGSYSMSRLANYRLQQHGITNNAGDEIWGVASGAEYGGAVGEMVIQYFAKPADAGVKPINISFNAAADLATTFYPPFTWHYHQSQWTPPFDSEVALTAIHSHHRMVVGYMDVIPANPPRPNDKDPICGAPNADGTPNHLYTDWYWEDAPVCMYWKQEDGPVPLRKGESLSTVCYVNNGITPEAIKHGLVAGASVQALKAMGAPIPDYPELVPASTWGDPLVNSVVGKELLYGTHPPVNYRVVYKCSEPPDDDRLPDLQPYWEVPSKTPGSTLVAGPEGILYNVCTPNPAVDADGDYIDGAYVNDLQCGTGNLCQPGTITFACIGEDEMCIGVTMYWAMPRLLSDRNDEAMQNLQNGDVNHVGTPGNAGTETDVSGICIECGSGPSP